MVKCAYYGRRNGCLSTRRTKIRKEPLTGLLANQVATYVAPEGIFGKAVF